MPTSFNTLSGLGVHAACPLRRCKMNCICPKSNGAARLGQARDALSPTRSTFGAAFEHGVQSEEVRRGGAGRQAAAGQQRGRKGGGKYAGSNVGGIPQLPVTAPISTRGAAHAAAQRSAMVKGRLQPLVASLNDDGSEGALTPPPDERQHHGLRHHHPNVRAEYPDLAGALMMNGSVPPPLEYADNGSTDDVNSPGTRWGASGPASRPRQWTDAEMQADALGQLAQARAEKAAATERADALAAQLEALVKVSSESAQENAELRKALRQATLATMSEDLERAGAPLEIVAEAPVNMTDAQSQSIEAAADDGDNDHVVQRRYSEAPIPVPGVHGTPAMPDSVPPATGIRHLDSTRFSRGSFFVSPDETAALAVRAKLELEVAGNAPPPAATMQPAVMTPSTEPGAAEHTPESERKVSVLYQTYKEEADLSFSIPSDYDYSATTTANYGVPYAENQQFYGKYPQIRELSDYGWHSNYTKERQLWHDKVVDSVVTKTQPQATPWIVYTCGPMGAGKGYALQWMSDNGFFPLDNIVHIDPDHFKSVMPEWDGYTKADTSTAGSQCHQESGYVQEIAQEVAMDNSQNIWVDGSLRNGEWFCSVYDDIRERFPRYRIAIFYVYASEPTIRARVKSREEKTGRGVPEQELVDSMQAPDKSLGMLVSKVDFIVRINNNFAVPRLAAFETVDTTGSWNALKSKFAHTQAHPSEFPSSLAPFWLHRFSPPHDSFAWTEASLAKVTLLGNQEASFMGLSDMVYEESYNISMHRLKTFLQNPQVRLSPIFPVNLDSESRAAAGIPADAQSFVFCYGVDLKDANVGEGGKSESKRRWSMLKPRWPSMDMVRLGTLSGTKKLGIDIADPFVALLIHGGYLYFDVSNRVCGATAILAAPSSANDSLLQFSDGDCIGPSASAHLIAELEGRFASITIPFMLASGALRYAWLLPGESFGSEINNKYGGFLYEFDAHAQFKCRFFPILGAVEH